MKRYIYFLSLAFGLGLFTSCDDDKSEMISEDGYSVDRLFMPMFRQNDNTGRGEDDPYRCQVVNTNDIILRWYGVKDAVGYEVKYALQPNVSSGLAEDWENPAHILGSYTVDADVLELLVEDLQYNTEYRFAIRALSEKGEGHHSKWYGYGNGREWADYLNIQTDPRYNIPEVLVVNGIQKNTFRVNLDLDAAAWESDATIAEHFEIDENNEFVAHTLIVAPSATNPDATVDTKWANYKLTAEDFERGYVDVTGLTENSVYTVDVKNDNVGVHWDAIYNTAVIRTDGTPGDPILIKHFCDPNDTIPEAVTYNACRIDTILDNYNSDATLAEGTIFYLEGGKNYYLINNVSLCKGLTLATNPEDVAKGLKATVYMGGINYDGSNIRTMNFMFGRQPQSGELGGINIKSLIFENINFDCPLAQNFGDGAGTGNYFINMYSNGMAVTLQSFEMRGCTLQRAIRGFIRVQGSNRKQFEKVIIEDNIFYNCGYYDTNGRGYHWIAGDGKNARSNIYTDFIVRSNTFYDSPRDGFFTDNNKTLAWGDDIHYFITLENNTFVNFSSRSSGRKIFNLRYMPGGSKLVCKKNLFIQTKASDDERNLYLEGIDVREVYGSGLIEFDFADNYVTEFEHEGTTKTGFTASAFEAKKNAPGKWAEYDTEGSEWIYVPNGAEELPLKTGATPIKATDLMVDPNPEYPDGHADMHETTTEKLFKGLKYKSGVNHEIVTEGIGDNEWWN